MAENSNKRWEKWQKGDVIHAGRFIFMVVEKKFTLNGPVPDAYLLKTMRSDYYEFLPHLVEISDSTRRLDINELMGKGLSKIKFTNVENWLKNDC